jgi:alpha-glucosidase (family GH31 glycosyl hydrolase)
LQYTDGNGNKNGTIYQEDITFGDQFFWDFTNPAAADYFVSSVVASLNDPAVDGTFIADADQTRLLNGPLTLTLTLTRRYVY